MESTTIRARLDSTLSPDQASSSRQHILKNWLARGEPDMVETLREHPELLRQHSVLLELAIDEYEARTQEADLDISRYCTRFDEFGSSVRRSIQRQLEVHRHFSRDGFSIVWPRAGDDFAGFQILEQLGAGASSKVYLALERAVGNRRVVLKVSPSTNFEASILGRLVHPCVTPLYSNGCAPENNLNYLCMPFRGRSTLVDVLEFAFRKHWPRQDQCIFQAATRWQVEDSIVATTSSLKARLRFGSYVDSILKIAIQIADGLIASHGLGIIHGDLKPSNVLLTPEVKPLLLDFNLSHDLSVANASWGGTIPYMPPERLSQLVADQNSLGEVRFTATSDIFSFGALVYELLTGVTPLGSDELPSDPKSAASEAVKRLHSGIQDPRERNPLVSKRLSRHLLRCLALDPIDRFMTMHDVRKALEAEKMSVASVVRRAYVRPVLFAILYGLPVTLFASGALYAMVRPPSFERDYRRGLELIRENNPAAAAEEFNAAITARPSFSAARFELARARLVTGEIELAKNDFALLANREKHLPSVAYLAYCFNLTQGNTTAIPLWEKVLANGVQSVAIHNNLAASYLESSNNQSLDDRLDSVERELVSACAIDPSSLSVNINFVRLAIKKSKAKPSYNPFSSWQAARDALHSRDADESVRLNVALWWSQVLRFRHERELSGDDAVSEARSNQDAIAIAEAEFERLYASFKSHIGGYDQAPHSLQGLLRGDKFFIEPK
jgi:eukaryotic-like serine/threonine-protein kinase